MDDKPLILIIDDIPQNLQLLGTILKKKQYEVAVATGGQQALNALENISPDLILLDIMMPEMDGYEVCRRIKENVSTSHIPVIFLTGKTETDDMVKGFRIGAADYVTKPFNAAELLARVNTHLDLKRSHDLLQQKNRELEEINASKDTFFSIISHDLKNPFTGLLNLTQLLRDDLDELEHEEIREFADLINESAEQYYKLLQNLLQWARLERGQMEYNPEQVNLKELVTQSLSLFAVNAEDKQIELKNKIIDDSSVYADPNMLDTVIRNLLSNAIKFTPEGGHVEVQSAKENGHIQLAVVDSGIGIGQEQQEKLFRVGEVFTTEGTKEEKGTGLGLLLCKQLVEKNNGLITIDSTPGEGTAIQVTLPLSEEGSTS